MKKLIFITILISVLLFNPYTMNHYIRPLLSKENETISSRVQAVDYVPGRYLGAIGDSLISYDGRSLKRMDGSLREIFSAPIRSDNFALDIHGEDIYLLDRVQKKVYSIDKTGAIRAQLQIESTPLTIKALAGGRFILHYITDVKVEGLLLCSRDCSRLDDIKYSKQSVNFIQEDGDKNGFLVSSLIRDSSVLKNNIYLYRFQHPKAELIMTTSVENTVFVKGSVKGNYIALMDTDYALVYDREFRPQCRISSEGSLRDLFFNGDGTAFYTLDSSGKLRRYDLKGKLMDEKRYKEEVLSVKFFMGEPLVVFRNGYVYRDQRYPLSKDIVDMVALDDKIAILFKENIEFVKVQ